MGAKPETIDAYLATVSADRRAMLEKLRKTNLSILPDAEECISYSMPAFRYAGHVVAGFLATSKGCSYFPFSGTTLATMAANVKAYDQTKSALHFDPTRPLPVALVRKLLKTRIAESEGAAPCEEHTPRAESARSGASRHQGNARIRSVPSLRPADPPSEGSSAQSSTRLSPRSTSHGSCRPASTFASQT